MPGKNRFMMTRQTMPRLLTLRACPWEKQMIKRVLRLAACLSLLWGPAAGAGELQVLAPPVVTNAGLKELAEDFTRQTGTPVKITVGEPLKIPERVHAEPTDVFFREPELMASLSRGDLHDAMPPVPLGRVHIGLAVKAGAPHPDISTTPKLIAVLKSAKIGVSYSNP